jgi:uncharacterized protein
MTVRTVSAFREDPTFLGTVEDVTGATIRAQLAARTSSGLSFIEGQSFKIGQLGGFVRIPLGFTDLYGIISQVGASAVPPSIAQGEVHGNGWLTIELVGEGVASTGFERGISQFPTVGDSVHLVTDHQLNIIYGRPNDARFVQVGRLASTEAIPALIDIDKLVTRHSAVVGTTGSGKSTTVAGILAALSDASRYPSARILVIDVHGEYGRALSDRAAVFRTNSRLEDFERPLQIPYWAMTYDEFSTIALGEVADRDRGAIMDRIRSMKLDALKRWPRQGISSDTLTVDSPVPFSVHQFWFDIYTEIFATHYQRPAAAQSRQTWALELDGEGHPVQAGNVDLAIPPLFRGAKDVKDDPEKIRLSSSSLNLGRQIEALGSKLRDPRFDFLFRPGPYAPSSSGEMQGDLDQLLASWLGDDHPISILDLSGTPPSIQTEIVGSVLRIIYDALFWARNLPEGGRERPLLVVLEEAHVYLGQTNNSTAATAVRRIAKEGRKYGIGVMLVSQRPSEIDSTILSQCGTMFAMRLTNSTDRSQIKSTVTDNLEGLLGMLPILRTGEAIILGEAVNLPIRTLIDRPNKRRAPDSSDPVVVAPGDEATGYQVPGGWNQRRDPSDYAEAVRAWRRQDARAEKTNDELRRSRTYKKE